MKKEFTFLAFLGKENDQKEKILALESGYECWNLKKFKLEDFIKKIKEKIPPKNDNVLGNYERFGPTQYPYEFDGISQEDLSRCSWGFLVPEGLDDALSNNYAEISFLLNLLSPDFLYPIFYVTDFGISISGHALQNLNYLIPSQNKIDFIKQKGFITLFRKLLPQSKYGVWQFDRGQEWTKEDWRLFVASTIFTELEKYNSGKNLFGWQRESADMCTILEALFTADDSKTGEVLYRLRKRIAVLLSFKFPDIEKDINNLYSQRSDFVHGRFFSQIAKDIQKDESGYPIPDIHLLKKQMEYIRWIMITYFYLNKVVREKPDEFNKRTTMKVLEDALIDINLRRKIHTEIEAVFDLHPSAQHP